ncbi:hypothetical protein HDU77_008828 [Chytriomyces hyalinus]|nr:hypothetical protein HDU77_008828 [Chytriomyces hyalinus]
MLNTQPCDECDSSSIHTISEDLDPSHSHMLSSLRKRSPSLYTNPDESHIADDIMFNLQLESRTCDRDSRDSFVKLDVLFVQLAAFAMENSARGSEQSDRTLSVYDLEDRQDSAVGFNEVKEKDSVMNGSINALGRSLSKPCERVNVSEKTKSRSVPKIHHKFKFRPFGHSETTGTGGIVPRLPSKLDEELSTMSMPDLAVLAPSYEKELVGAAELGQGDELLEPSSTTKSKKRSSGLKKLAHPPVASILHDLDLGDELTLSDTEATTVHPREASRSSLLTLGGGSTSQTLKRNAELASPLMEPEPEWPFTQTTHEQEEGNPAHHHSTKFDTFLSLIEFQLDMDPTSTIKSGISETTLTAISPPISPSPVPLHISKHALRRATSTPCQRITPDIDSELHATHHHSRKVNPIGKVVSVLQRKSGGARDGEKPAILSTHTGKSHGVPSTPSPPANSEQRFNSLKSEVIADAPAQIAEKLDDSKKRAGLKHMFKRGAWRLK